MSGFLLALVKFYYSSIYSVLAA